MHVEGRKNGMKDYLYLILNLNQNFECLTLNQYKEVTLQNWVMRYIINIVRCKTLT